MYSHPNYYKWWNWGTGDLPYLIPVLQSLWIKVLLLTCLVWDSKDGVGQNITSVSFQNFRFSSWPWYGGFAKHGEDSSPPPPAKNKFSNPGFPILVSLLIILATALWQDPCLAHCSLKNSPFTAHGTLKKLRWRGWLCWQFLKKLYLREMLIAEHGQHFKRKYFSKLNQGLSFIMLIMEKEKYFHSPQNFLKQQLLFFSKSGEASGMRQCIGQIGELSYFPGKETDLKNAPVQKQRWKGDLCLLCCEQLIPFLWWFLSVPQHWSCPSLLNRVEWTLLMGVLAPLLAMWLNPTNSFICKAPDQTPLFLVVFLVFPRQN